MRENREETNESNIQRFLDIQKEEYGIALKEIKNGRKVSCWMWYIFPQIIGLGKSKICQYYGIKNIEEAIEYLKNNELRYNLIEITQALLDLGDVNITKVMGYIDDEKLKSCMTLFNIVEEKSGIDCGRIFQKVLYQFFEDKKDEKTLKILEYQENIKKKNIEEMQEKVKDKIDIKESENLNLKEDYEKNKNNENQNIKNEKYLKEENAKEKKDEEIITNGKENKLKFKENNKQIENNELNTLENNEKDEIVSNKNTFKNNLSINNNKKNDNINDDSSEINKLQKKNKNDNIFLEKENKTESHEIHVNEKNKNTKITNLIKKKKNIKFEANENKKGKCCQDFCNIL